MQGGLFSYALLSALAIALLIAAVTDLRRRQIDNWLNGAIALGAPLFWFTSGFSWAQIGWQLVFAAIAALALIALFAVRAMGGGDVKLLAAVALWFPWQALVLLLVIMSLAGGVITLITLVHHRMSKRAGQPEIPYGVAIALAAIWLAGERIIYQFA